MGRTECGLAGNGWYLTRMTFVAMVIMVSLAACVSGQGPAMPPASSLDCSNTIPSLFDCFGFVTGMVKTPPATCCGNLSSVIQNQPQCLCQLFNTTLTDSLGINVTVAQQLPPKCKLQTPDPSLCELVGIPVPGPSSPSTDLAPTKAPSMSPSGPLPGQGPAMPPASSSDCSNTIPSLGDCVGFVTGIVTTPSASCCGNLSSVIQNQPQCLCQLFNTTLTDPLGINVTVAQQLPPKCKLQTPDPSLCELVGIPVPGPTNAPSMSPGGPLPGPSSESVPSSPGSGSGGSGSSPGSNAPLTTMLSVYTTLFLLSLSWILF